MGDSGVTWWGVGGSAGAQHRSLQVSRFYQQAGNWDKKSKKTFLCLEILLPCRRGVDTQSEPCQRFFRDGLTISFTKIMTDEAVSSWRSETKNLADSFSCFHARFDIHKCILKNCERMVELVRILLCHIISNFKELNSVKMLKLLSGVHENSRRLVPSP